MARQQASIGVVLAVVALGCGDGNDSGPKPTSTATATTTATATLTPTPTATATGTATMTTPPGPQITFFGVTRADDTLLTPNDMADDGTAIYTRMPGVSGLASGFVLVIEGRPGASGAPVGTSTYDLTGSSFPDLGIQATRPLGNGSATICDDPQVNPGGVPAIFPVSFDSTPQNIAAANDFACRFLDGAGGHRARTNRGDSCVSFSGTFDFVMRETTTQFCGFINVPLGLPPGDTQVTARLRDSEGNWGPVAEIIIRVLP